MAELDLVPRANYLPVPHVFNLNQACMVLAQAFGYGVYLVGSCLKKRDYRDVDVRAILHDEEYDRLFPGITIEQHDPLWSVMCASISLYLEKATGLPIDFQIQKQSEANRKYPGERHALGMFTYRRGETEPAPAPPAEAEAKEAGCVHEFFRYVNSLTSLTRCTKCGYTPCSISSPSSSKPSRPSRATALPTSIRKR